MGDSVIIASTSCEDESAANRLVFPVVASGESLQTTVTVGVEDIEPSTPRAWFLCYCFVHEKPAVTSILMEVDGFTSAEALTVSVGDKLKAVVKKEKQYAFATAQGARAGDRVALGCSCESLLTPMEELNASATATLVLATKPTCAVGVCYKFREEPEVFYSWAMTAYELSSLNGQSAFTKDVVSGECVHEGRGVGRALRVLVRGQLQHGGRVQAGGGGRGLRGDAARLQRLLRRRAARHRGGGRHGLGGRQLHDPASGRQR